MSKNRIKWSLKYGAPGNKDNNGIYAITVNHRMHNPH